jgi:hypothetical protein
VALQTLALKPNRKMPDVLYKATLGQSRTAKVLGAGSTSGLKLRVYGQTIDNVQPATTEKSTNAYYTRHV